MIYQNTHILSIPLKKDNTPQKSITVVLTAFCMTKITPFPAYQTEHPDSWSFSKFQGGVVGQAKPSNRTYMNVARLNTRSDESHLNESFQLHKVDRETNQSFQRRDICVKCRLHYLVWTPGFIASRYLPDQLPCCCRKKF